MGKEKDGRSRKDGLGCFTRILDYLSCAREKNLEQVLAPVGYCHGDQSGGYKSDEGGPDEVRPLNSEVMEIEAAESTDGGEVNNRSFSENELEKVWISLDHCHGDHLVKDGGGESHSGESHSGESYSDESHSEEGQPLKIEVLKTSGVKSPYVKEADHKDSGGLSSFFSRSVTPTGNDDGVYTDQELEDMILEEASVSHCPEENGQHDNVYEADCSEDDVRCAQVLKT